MNKKYNYLFKEKHPKILVEALKHFGLKEIKGPRHNPLILEMFRVANGRWIKDDETPWCGAFLGYVCKKVDLDIPKVAVRASEWLKWGTEQKVAMLGDILVFTRSGGGHVGIYVGEDKTHYHVLGGNQNDSVNIMRIAKDRTTGIRRSIWKIAEPANIRQIFLDAEGVISENEK